jgi:amino acid adenylation domain-containing protein
MTVENIVDIYELSPLQEGLLFHTLYAPASGMYLEQVTFLIEGDLNCAAFAEAWQQVVDRNSVLRTSLHWKDLGKPLQVVHGRVAVPITEQDWRMLPAAEQRRALDAFLRDDRHRDFELEEAPLMRVAVLRLGEHRHHIVWSFHHALLDGWSLQLVLNEVSAFYAAACEGRQIDLGPTRPFGDYIAWLQQQDLIAAESFWRRYLLGFTTPQVLSIGHSTDDEYRTEEEYGERQIMLLTASTVGLQAFARQHQLTINTLVQGALALLLARYTGDEDIVFGSTVSGRPPDLAGVEAMMGLFINTLPVRVHVDPDAHVLPWLKALLAQQVGTRQYDYTPLVQATAWSGVPAGTPLFESLLVFENYPAVAGAIAQDAAGGVSEFRAFERTNYPLTFTAALTPDLLIRIMYDSGRFDAAIVDRMLGHLQTLLEAMLARPEVQLRELPLLTQQEKRQLTEWNATRVEYRRDACVHELFEAQVELVPDRVAVVFEGDQLTYRELNWRANQLARWLQAHGVTADTPVGICTKRSIDMVIGVLGTLKAGGAYVPLDPTYPRDRLAFMALDGGTRIILSQEMLREKLPEDGPPVVCLDRDWAAIAERRGDVVVSRATADSLAYIIFTSGSTGRPKGVGMAHRPLVNLLTWQCTCSTPAKEPQTLQFTSLSFDVAFQEIFSTWCSGGTLVIVPETVLRDPVLLLQALSNNRIDRAFMPFVALQQLAQCAEERRHVPLALREIVTAGEQLQITPQIAALMRRLDNCRLHNHYGPTEAHVVTAYTLVPPTDDWPAVPPIGRPIANTRIYLLDRDRRPVPVGITGELHIAGDCLARGYVNRSELTRERFVTDPFDSRGGRLYKTGDLARYQPDGNIEFLGRSDEQVKIRGFRVELGEIEAVLALHPAMRQVAVVARGSGAMDRQLVAYLVADETRPDVTELRAWLQKQVPDFMVPSAFVFLDGLPMTPSGKVDRRALPAPGPSRPSVRSTYVPPRTATEQALAEIWQELLGLERVGIDDNFFELGGHSLLATRLISRVRTLLHVDLPIRALFEAPTVARLAEVIPGCRDLPSTAPADVTVVVTPQRQTEAAAEVDSLSDEEVEALLRGLLSKDGALE